MSKLTRTLKRLGGAVWSGILYVWNRPILVSVLLLTAAYFLFNIIIQQTFKPYMNCNYMIVTKLGMDSFFCNGYDVKVLGSTVFSIPGLNGVMNPPLELARTIIAWAVIVFFAFISVYLTIIINNFKSVIKIVTLNKEEWRRFMASVRIWLALFVGFCSVFYFTVIK
ncbi:MAG: hypothetical protein AB1750_10650 [Chloroflexota bacterium]